MCEAIREGGFCQPGVGQQDKRRNEVSGRGRRGRIREREKCQKDNGETGRCSLCVVRCDVSNWSGGGEVQNGATGQTRDENEKVR